MNSNLDVHEVHLTCLAPVHIGSGEKFNKTEYIYDCRHNRAYFLDESAWIRFLSQRRLMTAFCHDVQSGVVRDLYRWCRENNIGDTDIARLAVGWAHVAVHNDHDTKYLNDLSPLLRGADGRPYIPGSSIKGALRTAILHHLLGQCPPEQKRRYWQAFCGIIGAKPDRRRLQELVNRLTAQVERDLLHKLLLRDEHGQAVDRRDAVTSVMKGLQVSDAYRVEEPPTCIVRKIDWQIGSTNRAPEKALPLSRECFTPGTVFKFTLGVAPAVTGAIGLETAAQVLAAAREFTQHLLALEEAAGEGLSDLFAAYRTANIVLGGGAGLLAKTLLYSLASREEARRMTAAMLDIQFTRFNKSMHKHAARDAILSPRTIKLGYYQSQRYLQGLGHMALISC